MNILRLLNPYTILIVGSSILASPTLYAEKPGFTPLDIEEVTVTAYRLEKNINEIPASIAIIDQSDITSLQPSTLSDLFRYQPGINIERSSGRHGDANINIRGIGGNRVLVIKDGVRMPDGFGSAGVDQGRGNFSAYSLDSVEVLKGSASALYGSDALGGVVLLNSLDPEKTVKNNNNQAVVQLNAAYQSNDHRKRLSLMSANKLGASYTLLKLERQGFDEGEVNSGFEPDAKDGELSSALAKWSFRPSQYQRWEILTDYWQQDTKHQLDSHVGPISGPAGSRLTKSNAQDESSRWHLGLHHEINTTAWFDTLRWQLDYQSSDYQQDEYEQQENPASITPPIPARATAIKEHKNFEQQQWSFSIQGVRQLGKHDLSMGVDLLRKSLSRPVHKTQTNLISGAVSFTDRGVTYPGKTFPDTDIEQYGIYLQDLYHLSEQWRIMFGARFDYFRSTPNVDAAYSNFNLTNAPVESRSDSKVSPHLGITYHASDSTQLYVNYTTGFRAPPVDDQFISRAILIPRPGAPHEVIPNNNLAPETSQGVELGWRWQQDRLSLQAAVYRTRYKDFIDSKTIGFRQQPPTFVGPLAIRQIQYQNVDEVEISGAELGSQLIMNDWLPGQLHGTAKLALNWIEGEDSSNGQGLNSVGPNTAVLGFNLHNPGETLGMGWHLKIAEKADEAEPLNRHGRTLLSFEPPGYSTHDVNFFWRPRSTLRLDLSVFNAFNKRYWSAHKKGSDANGDLEASIEPGRSFALSINLML